MKSMRVYYAHPMSLYGTPQESRDITLLDDLGFSILNPGTETHQKECLAYGKGHGGDVMGYFLRLVRECEALAFRAFPCGAIGAGIVAEIAEAQEKGLPVFELPTAFARRSLSVDDTREYLHDSGQR